MSHASRAHVAASNPIAPYPRAAGAGNPLQRAPPVRRVRCAVAWQSDEETFERRREK